MSDRAALARAWETWDRVMGAMPRHASSRFGARETNAMEDGCQALAAELGVPCSQLRRDLIAATREGMDYSQAIDHVASQPARSST